MQPKDKRSVDFCPVIEKVYKVASFPSVCVSSSDKTLWCILLENMSRQDDFEHITEELEKEKKHRQGVEDSNIDSEKSVFELEGYLRHLDDQFEQADENIWKVRYETQTALNIHLSEERHILEEELAEMRWKCHAGAYPDAMNFNVEIMTESELIRLVKHMERVRKDTFTTLRDAEHKIDKEKKEIGNLDDMRRTFHLDLKHAKQAVERIEMEKVLERIKRVGATPPLDSPEYAEWLDKKELEGKQVPEATDNKESKDVAKEEEEGEDEETPEAAGGEPKAGESSTGEGENSGEGEETGSSVDLEEAK